MSGRVPLLVVLSGPSGAGKDAVLDELARRGHRFHRVVTCTTRPRRPGERDGVDYYFVTDAAFDQLIAEGGLLEHATVYGHRSGVPRQQVVDRLREGLDVYVRTDVQGAASIKELAPEAVRVFIAPASLAELEERIRARGTDDEERVQRRLATARDEMARRSEFDYVIVNEPGRLETTVDRLAEILDAERLKTRPQSL
ncbi:MAG TPA: guanylate kinase [Dehalococcoidia bacterium]|nr:guanylate kinase [Dehalococcoidia bacterium]